MVEGTQFSSENAVLIMILFFSACGIQHLQRGGNRQFTWFESLYFTVVTLSTVGFGDLYPDIYISQIFMLFMIGAALIILPTQVQLFQVT